MMGWIFRNPKLAALWALGTMASVGAFFAEGGGQQKLAAQAETIRAQKEELANPTTSHTFAIEQESEDGFTPDKELFVDEDAAQATAQQSHSGETPEAGHEAPQP